MLLPSLPQSDTVIIAAPGPSLTREQVAIAKESGHFFITIGEVGRLWATDADVLYHCESKWWNYYNGVPQFTGLKAAMQPTNHEDVYHTPRSALDSGLDLTYPYLVTGANSGYQAINLAAHLNPKKIILIGYDMKNRDRQHNIAGDHPADLKRPWGGETFVKIMPMIRKPLEERGITVYNSTIDTALTCFQKKELTDALRS